MIHAAVHPSFLSVLCTKSIADVDPKMPSDGGQGAPNRSQCCARMSVYFVASLAVLVLAAVAFFISLTSTNWSASGQQLKMGIWDFCIHPRQNTTWSCYPANAGEPLQFRRLALISVRIKCSSFSTSCPVQMFARSGKSSFSPR